MENYQLEAKKAVKILQEAKKKIELVMQDENITPLKSTLINVLNKQISGITINLNLDDEPGNHISFKSGPLKKIMGRDVFNNSEF